MCVLFFLLQITKLLQSRNKMQTNYSDNIALDKQQLLYSLVHQISVLQKQCQQVLNEEKHLPMSNCNLVAGNNDHKLSPFALVMQNVTKSNEINQNSNSNNNSNNVMVVAQNEQPVSCNLPFYLTRNISNGLDFSFGIVQPVLLQAPPQVSPQVSPQVLPRAVLTNNNRKKPDWHLASHKLFRDALQKQIFVCLHEEFFSQYLLKLKLTGVDLHVFAKKMERFLYYSASRIEEYLEYSSLRQRMMNSFCIVKRKCIGHSI